MLFFVLFGFYAFSEGILVPIPDSPEPSEFPNRYRTFDEMKTFLSDLSANYSNFASVYSIGNSVEGREILVLAIKVPNSPIVGAPNLKFVGNIHGNEPVGRELILNFAEYLLKNYETDSEVKWILDRTIIHLLPSLNPDGFERSKEGDCYLGPGRENGNLVDLNRNFPDHVEESRIPVQPETLAVATWMSKIPFVLSASFHGGALVANYPYDNFPLKDARDLLGEVLEYIRNGAHALNIWFKLTPNGSNGSKSTYLWYFLNNPQQPVSCHAFTDVIIEKELLSLNSSLTPDDDVFRHLAQTYSNNHLLMHKGRTCYENQPFFPGGITNGAAWYSFSGGMQDYNYVAHGCMELTLEISCCKYPLGIHLPRLWLENKRAMLALAKQALIGVRGLIIDSLTSRHVPEALLRISGRNVPFRPSKDGEFWRILLPGDYILVVEAEGYEPQSFPFTVRKINKTHPTSTWLSVYLEPTQDLLASASSNTAQIKENSANFHSSFPVLVFFPVLLSKWS